MLLISEKHVMLIELIIVVILSMNAVEEENLLKHIPVTAVNIVSIIYLHTMFQKVICSQKHCIML